MIVATAGHDTTSSSTAGAMWALAERPDELAKVKADPSLIPGLVDESIRWTTPVKPLHAQRPPPTPSSRGQAIAKGDWLMLCYPSGNRDEEVFEDPDEFRVDRSPNQHLAFGYGAHLCLGQHLAKMEMRILWEELLPRLKSVELAGEAKLSEANFVSGPKTPADPLRSGLRPHSGALPARQLFRRCAECIEDIRNGALPPPCASYDLQTWLSDL